MAPPFFLVKPPGGAGGGGTNVSGLYRTQDPVSGLYIPFDGWEPGQIVVPPSGAHAHFDLESQNPDNVGVISLREPQHMTESWTKNDVFGAGVARSLSPLYFSYDPVQDGCRNLNSEEAWIASGRPPGFAGWSHDSGRQQRMLHRNLSWAAGDRRISLQFEFMYGDKYQVGAGEKRFDDPVAPSTGTGWNTTLKLCTSFSPSIKFYEFQVSSRGDDARGWSSSAGVRWYGMGASATQQVMEPNLASVNPLETDYGEPDGGSTQFGGDTQLRKGARSTYTYQNHLNMQAGDTTEPFLIRHGVWNLVTQHIELFSPFQWGYRVYMSDETTPAKLILASRANPGQPLMFDSSVNGGDPLEIVEFRIPEHNTSTSGNHADTIWTPVISWYRNCIVRAGDENSAFISPNWQPIGTGA